MTPTCLQQRDSYPYMFHDPLALGSPYGRNPCNPTTAHQQSVQHTAVAAAVYSAGSAATVGSTGNIENNNLSFRKYRFKFFIKNFYRKP